MTYLKNNITSIVLFLIILLYIWRNDTLKYQRDNAELKAQKEFIIQHLSEVESKLKANEIKTLADSIQRNEILKTYEKKYSPNLSHTRLLFIRDSLRARYNMSNR